MVLAIFIVSPVMNIAKLVMMEQILIAKLVFYFYNFIIIIKLGHQNYYYYNNSCLINCLTGTYKNILSKTCDKCDFSCKECNGPSNIDCSSCNENVLFFII